MVFRFLNMLMKAKALPPTPLIKSFTCCLNIAVGGNWGDVQGIDTSVFPVSMEVDYVRVYKMIP